MNYSKGCLSNCFANLFALMYLILSSSQRYMLGDIERPEKSRCLLTGFSYTTSRVFPIKQILYMLVENLMILNLL
jgi:hypothetical protein